MCSSSARKQAKKLYVMTGEGSGHQLLVQLKAHECIQQQLQRCIVHLRLRVDAVGAALLPALLGEGVVV